MMKCAARTTTGSPGSKRRYQHLCQVTPAIPHLVGIDSTGVNASLKGNWPITEQFDVFGKVGYYFWDADIDLEGNSGQEENSSGSDLSWGIGAGYNFTDNFSITTEYQWFQIEEADAEMWTGNLVWKF